jgi:integrase
VSRVNFHLDIANTMYNFATKLDKNLDRVNPFHGLRLREKVRADKKQDPFSREDLKKLFCLSPEYGQDKLKHAHHFWIPLISLYTGARLDEICQLLRTDVINRDGYWCLDIKEHDAPELKSVKQGERRIVPLHPFLVKDLKFINYVMSIDKSETRVFPKLNRTNDRWGHAFGQWFGKFKKRCGIKAPPRKKTFHSFRHTLINFCKQNDIAEKHTSEFVGHRNRKITYGVYGKQFKPQKLYKEIVAKLDYGIDLSHLKKSRYVIKDKPKLRKE